MLEPVVGQSGRARQNSRAALGDDFDRDRVQGGDDRRARRPAPRSRGCAPAGRPSPRSTVSLERPAARCQAARQFRRRRVVPRQREDARAWLQMRNDRLERPAMQRDQRAILLAPAEPRRGEAKAEGAGKQIISSASKRRISIAPTPKKNGSPLASTQTEWPRRATIASSASSIGEGQDSVSAFSGPARARWRFPPTTKSACAMSAARQGRGRRAHPRRCRQAKPAFACSWSRLLNRLRLLILGGTSEASALARRSR